MTKREAAGLAAQLNGWACTLEAIQTVTVTGNGAAGLIIAAAGRDVLVDFLRRASDALVNTISDEPLTLAPNPKETP
jgi:hypothetical protein